MSEPLFATRPVATPIVPDDSPPAGDSGHSPHSEIVSPSAPQPLAASSTAMSSPVHNKSTGSEPLARIEDKTSRIEEKLARSEASMQRVVDRFEVASSRMNEVALQSDLAAVRGEVAFVARRVRSVPGTAALLLMSVVTAALSAVAVILILRYFPGAVPR